MANRIEVRRKRDLAGYRVVVRDGVPIGRVKLNSQPVYIPPTVQPE